MESNFYINVAIIGAVSAGKSTLLNTLFVEKYSDMKMKRTTMLPQVYQETNNKELIKSAEEIKDNNKKINDEYIKKTEGDYKLKFEDCVELLYYVDKIYDFQKLKQGVYLNIYDIPGINSFVRRAKVLCFAMTIAFPHFGYKSAIYFIIGPNYFFINKLSNSGENGYI